MPSILILIPLFDVYAQFQRNEREECQREEDNILILEELEE